LKKAGKLHKYKRFFLRAIIFGFIFFCIHTLVIVIDGLIDRTPVNDVALVPGCPVNADGTPSPWLKTRLDRAADLYQKKLVKQVIVSSGITQKGLREADYMKQYLTGKGIPADSIIADNNGYNTYMTARNYDSIRKVHGFKTVTLVTQFYHITRNKMSLLKFGIKTNGSAHGKDFFGKDAFGVFREFFAFYKYLLFPRKKLEKYKLPY
jgi:vancomycin permeability regulator SanA